MWDRKGTRERSTAGERTFSFVIEVHAGAVPAGAVPHAIAPPV
jgi:hypothetical protein